MVRKAMLKFIFSVMIVTSVIQIISSQDSSSMFLITPADQKVAENELASFPCIVRSPSVSDISWYFNDKKISTRNQRYLIAPIADQGDGARGSVLRIEMTKARRDEGVFECRVESGTGQPAVAKANLSVYPEGSVPAGYPRIISPPTMKSVEKSRDTALTCTAEGNPGVTIHWFRNYVPVDLTNPRYSLLSTGALQIVEAEESDMGKYECAAENSLGIKYSFSVNLYVKAREVFPYFSIPPEDVEVVPGSNTSINCVAVGSPMPHVKWRQGAQELTPEDEVPIGKNVLTLQNIRRSANYTCVASSNLGNIEYTVEVRVKDLPRSPVNLLSSKITSQSVQLSWSAGGTDHVDFYIIQYRQKGQSWSDYREIRDVRMQSHVITGLEPYTTYQLIVMSSNSIGTSLPSEVIEIVTLQDVPASAPDSVRVRASSQTSITVQWEEPKKSNGIITGYSIYYTLTPDLLITLWSRVSVNNSYTATLGDLITNNTYTLSISASTYLGDGPLSIPMQVRVQKGVPQQPKLIEVEAVSDKAIRVTWLPLDDQVEHFVIYCNGAGKFITETVLAEFNSHRVTNLLPNTQYTVEMSAKTSSGESARTPGVTVKTLEPASSGAPLEVSVESVDSTSLRITWAAPDLDLRKDPTGGYRVYYTLASSQDDVDVVPLSVPGTELELVVKGLEKWTEYKLWVRSFRSSGEGPPSVTVTARTDEDLPGEPTQVRLRALNTTSVLVQWSPPAPNNVNGVLRGYYIYYALYDEVTDSGKFSTKDISGGSQSEAVIGDLRPGSLYQVQVAAYTKKGDGIRSRLRKIRTKEVKGSRTVGPPVNLYLRQVPNNPSTVTLTWEAPRGQDDMMASYRVEWSVVGSDEEAHVQETSHTSIVVHDLEYGTEYEFRVSTKSRDVYSEEVVETITTMNEKPSSAPVDVRADVITATSIKLIWSTLAPDLSRGKVTQYDIRYSLSTETIGQSSTSTTSTYKVIEGLASNQNYVIQVRACTSSGCGPWSKSVDVRTHERYYFDVPGNIRVNREVPTSAIVSWTAPNISGIIGYRVYFGLSADPDIKNWNSFVDSDVRSTRTRISNLMPNSQYYVMVRSKLHQGTFGSWSEIVTVKPQVTSESYGVKKLKATVITDSSITLHWSPPEESGVTLYLVEYQRENEKRVKRSFLPVRGERNVSSSSSLTSFHNLEPNFSYIFSVTPKFLGGYWGPKKSVMHPMSADDGAIVPPDHENVEDLQGSPEYETSSMSLLQILAPVCGGIVAILLIILLVVYMRKRCASKKVDRPKSKALLSIPVENPPQYTDVVDNVEMGRFGYSAQAMDRHPAVPVERFAYHVELLKANDRDKLSQEYESIEPGQTFTWDASNLECNSEKNRYANVVAYDHSRVILENGFYRSDYINANYIDGYSRPKSYIATQGPLESTAADFWQMVWEQFSHTIVMMTKLEERNRVKCDRYWPNYGTETYGRVNVTLIDIIELATYTMRVFNISESNSSDKRTVHQFQFTAWPDHGVPNYPTPLLQFVRRVKALTPPNVGPAVVHCSAGVGRTGAYIVIDAMLDRIQTDGLVDVYNYVTHLRAQRNYMVQTVEQYMFIHEAILEAITAGDSEVHAERLYIHIQQLTQFNQELGCTKMEVEFSRLNERKPDTSDFRSANLPYNRTKNRLQSILPYDSTRVCLQMIRGVDGSDYINANYIDGYHQKKAYIATQGPLEDTTEDFWRMLWENNCTVVVMLTKLQELGKEKCYQYWPEQRPATYKYFAVEPLGRFSSPLDIAREFKVTDVRSGQSRTLRHFQFTEWPEQGVPDSGEGFIEFIGKVQKVRDQTGQDGPITIHCSHGVGRTGVFISLSIVLERMKSEGVIDMYQTVNMLRTQRPGMVQTEDQYAFCHRAALEYLSSFDHYGSVMYNSMGTL